MVDDIKVGDRLQIVDIGRNTSSMHPTEDRAVTNGDIITVLRIEKDPLYPQDDLIWWGTETEISRARGIRESGLYRFRFTKFEVEGIPDNKLVHLLEVLGRI